MYAAKAASLPSPTKWFSIGPYFRAEKPQRGRLREFLQWNVDVLGGEDAATHDRDAVSAIVDLCRSVGLRPSSLKVVINDRRLVEKLATSRGLQPEHMQMFLWVMDNTDKKPVDELLRQAKATGIGQSQATIFGQLLKDMTAVSTLPSDEAFDRLFPDAADDTYMFDQNRQFKELGILDWIGNSITIARGLAYYTGTVFEVIAEGERAIAGGGRYDNLIELFGGPPTPAVGFGMGDVVLGLLLEDKGLMPQGKELMDALGQPAASLRPEAFVVAGSEDEDALIEPLLANLRRGIESDGFDGKPWSGHRYSVRPMHARRTYKTTRNLKKLLADAEKQHARFAIVLHGKDKVHVK